MMNFSDGFSKDDLDTLVEVFSIAIYAAEHGDDLYDASGDFTPAAWRLARKFRVESSVREEVRKLRGYYEKEGKS